MIQGWLEIIPASEQNFVLQEQTDFKTDVLRSKLWYRGDSAELFQFFHALNDLNNNSNCFWGSTPMRQKIRKIHSGLPAVIADTLAYIVCADLDKIEISDINAQSIFEEISNKTDFLELVKSAIVTALVEGDGAFKISVDTDISDLPIVEFVGADRTEYNYSRGTLKEVVFTTQINFKDNKYFLKEFYGKGYIESKLYNQNSNEISLNSTPETESIKPLITFNGDYIMAVPLKFYNSKKYFGRGKSIFDGGKSDCFDALDEVISQWWDALRMGRVKQYIPNCMIPRSPENGGLNSPNQFGNNYISTDNPIQEGVSPKIEVVQPDIKYEAFAESYSNCLLMCLQGLVSPATLGIDVGKMSSADAQREKKDVTGNTRNTITTTLEKALSRLINAVLKTYDNMLEVEPKEYEIIVSFGEYGSPDFDSRVETVGKAGAYGIMSVQTQVEELWGSSKDDEWKAEEVKRLMKEKGLESEEISLA